MTLNSNAHINIAGLDFLLDEGYEDKTGHACYRHYGHSLFQPRNVILSNADVALHSLNPDLLIWNQTNFDGEGRVVYEGANAPGQFYSSEGLDMRVPGEFKLNRSSSPTSPLDPTGGATTTKQGNADFTDGVGTSTTSGTDRRLTLLNDRVDSSVHTPGASRVQADFYLYRDGFTSTTVLGSALKLDSGNGQVSGANFVINRGGGARTASFNPGAGVTQRVEFYGHSSPAFRVGCEIRDMTVLYQNFYLVVAQTTVTAPTADGLIAALDFTPVSGHSYRFVTYISGVAPAGVYTISSIKYGPEVIAETAIIEVYNSTGSVSVTSSTVSITATGAGSALGSLVYTAAAATNYKYRVTWTAGQQNTCVDTVVATVQSTSVWALDDMELGYAGLVRVVGHRAGVDSQTWSFTTASNSWTAQKTLPGATSATCYAMAHSDAFQYYLLSDTKVYRSNDGAGAGNTEAYTTDAITVAVATNGVPVGMCITQDRIFVLEEDSTNGVVVRTMAVDGAVNTWALQQLASVTVTSAHNTADTSFRQRMCSSPTGARFFVNYSDVTAKIYECDASGSTLTQRELADLGHGVKATAIAYEGGITFIAGQFIAESDQTPRTALWIIDANGVLQRIGFFRYDNPNANIVSDIVPYQTNLFMLQGPYVWRYSLVTGGLFLEYQLQPQQSSHGQALAVLQGRTLACYQEEVWTTGASGTYRQGGYSGANQFTSSVHDFGLPTFPKILMKCDLVTAEMPANTAILVEYQLDQTGTWTTLGTMNTGASATFFASGDTLDTTFATLQYRVTPISKDGVSTPTVYDLVWTALPTVREEFFDLVLLLENDTGSFRPDGIAYRASDKAAIIYDKWRKGTFTTLVDGYASTLPTETDSYLVVIDDFDRQQSMPGEGRAFLTCRVVK